MGTLLRLLLRRLAALPLMILGVTFLVFVILKLSPGDEATQALGEGASSEAKEAYRAERGLNLSLPVQYIAFLGRLLTLDFGVTTPPSRPVAGMIAQAFPLTLQLTAFGVLIAVVISLVFGVLGALYRDRLPDQLIRVFSIAAVATPSFWLGILLIQWLALGKNPLFPSGGMAGPGEGLGGWLAHMTLPAFALAIPVSASLIRVVRTSMVEELDKDYVRTAIGNGVPRNEVISRNVLRNALVTPVTVLGLRIGYLLGGAVVIEMIFSLPGMGQLILNGITAHDTNLVQGVVLAIAVTFVLVNILVDLVYLLINPRIRTV
ncbi:MAG: ABC transporter permease [Arthrobacter sp.]|uniref:ABC transporter permease n=1 Tax=unclassified Arthrobacter TaxID=235627 RepID=UPI0026535A17|nr:ABC transporter permease [Micrococcaceae bacterium]MDN5812899.1 ABC transporter permease [Micrococcaceae bacterium]MDN5824731.1 ABC transporter permease [Micrococcaceae bacterium]MDN5879752.1 ABC transporter permease [Micrococcaceae bacterium]MDN5887160.1 ABC transporter permease [Micrococcaceae bacterium]